MCIVKSSRLLGNPKAQITTAESVKITANVAKAEKIFAMAARLNPKRLYNGQSAAKQLTRVGSSTTTLGRSSVKDHCIV